jgi:SulP family sulfate permease
MLGFTTGATLLIAWYALASMLGGMGRESPPAVLQRLPAAAWWPALLVGGVTLLLAVAGRRWWRRGPTALLALAVGAGAGAGLEALGHAAPRLGAPPTAWVGLLWPTIDWGLLPELLPMALALTIVALGQSMSIAKLLAARRGERLEVNRECAGQGLANLSSALSGGFVACGSLNRSVPHVEAGARTPIGGVSAALWLALLVLVAGPLLAWIPLAGVGALLLLAAASLVDPQAWRRLWHLGRQEFGIALATAVATLVLRLEVAVLAGVMLSLVAYLYRTAAPAMRTMGFDRSDHDRHFVVLADARTPLPECPQLKLLRMEGSVWFGAVAHVAEQLRTMRERQPEQRHLLVMSKSMNFIDHAAADLWDDERVRRRTAGGDLYFHRPRPQVLALWQRTGFLGRLGPENVFEDKRSAIARIVPLLDASICAQCSVRLFEECSERPGAPLSPMI